MQVRPVKVLGLGAVLGVLSLLCPREAFAFCRTMACSKTDPTLACYTGPDGCQAGTQPLYWPTSCISYSVQEDGSKLRGIDFETTEALVAAGFNAWLSVDCGGGQTPSLAVENYGRVSCSTRQYNQDQPNANVFMYRDGGWPYVDAEDTLALTTLTFNTKTAEIYDADVEINSFDAALSVGDSDVTDDLPSILNHEIGHFLGLSHSIVPDATMFKGYVPGNTEMRSLSPDDVAGMCAIYPPNRDLPPAKCDPRHGFSRECATKEDDSGCACSLGRVDRTPNGALAWLAAGLLASTRFRRRQRR